MASKSSKLEAVHKEALERFELVYNAEKDQRTLAIEDMRFAHAEDGQWDEDAITKRKDRPRYTLNRVAGAIDQVCGDQRQNRTQIKVRPVRDGSKDVAKIEMGLIRNIEGQSDAESIYDAAFDEVATCGYGGWRVLTQFTDDDTFEQDIVIAPIKSAASSLYMDPSAQKPSKSDAMWGFYITDMVISRFHQSYPNATVSDFSDKQFYSGSCSGWFREDKVRVAEYWVVDMVPATIALMSDGRVINKTEEQDVIDELAAKGITILKERQTSIRKVSSYIMNGAEILKGPMKWAGKYIPLIPVYGRTFNIEGKEYIRGLVRFAKDPNRIYNYATSTAIEVTALTPKDPIWITAAQAKGHEAKLKTFNTSNSPFMVYNTDPSAPGAPQRGGAPQLQQGLIQQQMQAADDIHATTGLYAPAMGNAPQLLSEKSVIAQADKGDRGVFVFSDNLHKAIKYTGDILVDLMPRIYDTERVIRVLNFDGTTEDVEINAAALNEFNQPVIDEQTGEQVIVNDLSRGKYETYVEAGPAFKSMRKESAGQLIELISSSPRFEAMAYDLVAKSMDILDGEEFAERARKQAIKEGIAVPTEEEIEEMGLDQPQEPSAEQAALLENVQMQTAEMAANIENKNADTDKKDADNLLTKMKAQKEAILAYKELMESYKLQQEMGVDLGITEAQLVKAQQGIIDLSQGELVVNNI
jgi:hypothetical protein